MCGRYYIDEGMLKELERILKNYGQGLEGRWDDPGYGAAALPGLTGSMMDLTYGDRRCRPDGTADLTGIRYRPDEDAGRIGEIRPSDCAVVLTGRQNALSSEVMRWGFLQYRQKGLVINARAETVLERPMFRDSVLFRRCVIPAKHFYEWDKDKNRVTFWQEHAPGLYMAGFYNCFDGEDRFVILTVCANDSVKDVHDRMPLILKESELESWVYDDGSWERILKKKQPGLARSQEYEQMSLLLSDL